MMSTALLVNILSIPVVIVVSACLAVYSWKQRDIAGAKPFFWMILALLFLGICEGALLLARDVVWASFWFDLRFFSLAFAPVLWFLFVFEFTGKKTFSASRHKALLFVIPALTQILIWTNAWHSLWVGSPVGFRPEGLFILVDTSARVAGPWLWMHYAYSYGLVILGLGWIILSAFSQDRRTVGQIVSVAAGAVIMAAAALAPGLGWIPSGGFNPLAPGMALGSMLMFWGIYRYRFLRSSLLNVEERRGAALLIALFLFLTLGIIAAGSSYYRHYEKNYRTEFEHLLASIAELKVSELLQWRKERLADAAVLYNNENFAGLVRRVSDRPMNAEASKRLRIWLEQIRKAYHYRNVMLLDADGRVRLSLLEPEHALCAEVFTHVNEARQARAPMLLDFHREGADGAIRLAVLSPVFDGERFLGVIVLVIDPHAYLYPMISNWPTPAQTAETLLVRKEGNEVVFLNELKFQKQTALSLRFPLSRKDLPAARAASGTEGVIEGIDYRGVPVVAALKAVPDSPWFMIARMDRQEIYAPIRERFWVMMILVFAFIGAAGGAVLFLWQRQTGLNYRRRAEAARALETSEEKFRKAFMTSPDAIALIRWQDGRVISVNSGFSNVTGCPREEVEGAAIGDLPIWTHADSRTKLLEKLQSAGVVENEEVPLQTAGGEPFYALVSASVLNIDQERHILTIARDITERKQSENALAEAHERLRSFFNANIFGIVVAADSGNILEANDYYLSVIGFSRAEFEAGLIDWRKLTPSQWLDADNRAIDEVRRKGTCDPYEKQYRRRDGSLVDVLLAVARVPGQDEHLAAFVLDISDRKRIEREMRKLNEELEARVAQRTSELQAKNEELARLNRVFVDRELRMRELKEKIAQLERDHPQ